jgi:hypothetical protein
MAPEHLTSLRWRPWGKQREESGLGRVPYPPVAENNSANTEIAAQRTRLEAWLATDAATTAARRLITRRRLDCSPDDLINDAWIRIRQSFTNRTEPLPDLDDEQAAARYCARVLDNLCRDRLRQGSRRRELSLTTISGEAEPTSDADPSATAETRILVEQLLFAVGRRAENGLTCAGCQPAVVAATALEILHLVLNGDDTGDRGRTWFDQMLHTALERVDPNTATTEAARNQRKSRCGRCVSELLTDSMRDLMGDEP